MSERSFCHTSQWIEADAATVADFYANGRRPKLIADTASREQEFCNHQGRNGFLALLTTWIASEYGVNLSLGSFIL